MFLSHSSFNFYFPFIMYPERALDSPENNLKSRWESLLGPDYEVMVCENHTIETT